ncbi:hypothetical protein K0I73_15455 [Shewanella mesophila]|uniref:hypothetical protein n=1 Tax=Shewanella mesophila TaxID=2864208 RepID=UPI001C65C1C5|nr:hypothetical protein [Shewanella mesophila]QYJ85573.1 hypothetical protein K0I73_15455 [Shewanella mesophila]
MFTHRDVICSSLGRYDIAGILMYDDIKPADLKWRISAALNQPIARKEQQVLFAIKR